MKEVLILRGKGLLQKLCQHILFQQLNLTVIRHTEGRIHTDLMKMIADDKQTKAVDGSNLGIMKKGCLLLNMLRLRMLP